MSEGGSPKLRALPGRADSALDPALWARFAQATDADTLFESWLALQCAMIPGVVGAVLVTGSGGEAPFLTSAAWPDPSAPSRALAEGALRGLRERHPLVIKPDGPDGEDTVYHVVYPVRSGDRLLGAVALAVTPRPEARLQAVMRQLQWGSAWLELQGRRERAALDEQVIARQGTTLDLVATLLEQERFFGSASAFVTELAGRLACERVSLGLVRGDRTHLEVLSHSSDFGKRANLVRALEAAMDETLDARAPVIFPAPTGAAPRVTRAHAELSRLYGAGAVCSVPVHGRDRVIGVLTLERADLFDEPTLDLVEAVALIAGPLLEARRREERPLADRVRAELAARVRRRLGRGQTAARAAAVAGAALLLFVLFARGDYLVTADTVLEPSVLRAAVASFEGYIAEVAVRPGDLVREGDLLAALDDRELRLERLRLLSERDRATQAYRNALSDRDAAEAELQSAQIEEASAELALLDERLARTRIVAPFNGVVVSGDLSQSLAAPVSRGELLFEIAPLDAYRVILEVDEREIGQVEVGQTGHLVLSAFASEPLGFTVEKLTPVSESFEGRNYFRVEARLDSPPERLQPGMEGVGKVNAGRRRLLWIWTHDVVDWVRLALWRWLP